MGSVDDVSTESVSGPKPTLGKKFLKPLISAIPCAVASGLSSLASPRESISSLRNAITTVPDVKTDGDDNTSKQIGSLLLVQPLVAFTILRATDSLALLRLWLLERWPTHGGDRLTAAVADAQTKIAAMKANEQRALATMEVSGEPQASTRFRAFARKSEWRARAAVVRGLGLTEAALAAASAMVEDFGREASAMNSAGDEELYIEGLKEAQHVSEVPEVEEEQVDHTPDHDDVMSLWWSSNIEALTPRTKRVQFEATPSPPAKSAPSPPAKLRAKMASWMQRSAAETPTSPKWVSTGHGTYTKGDDAAGAA